MNMPMPGPRLVFGVCVALSLGLHVLLLAPWPEPASMQGAKAAAGPTILQARLFDPVEVETPKALSSQMTPARPAKVSTQPIAAQPPADRSLQTKPRAEPSPAPQSDGQSAEAPVARSSAPAGEPDGYVPRSQLTEPPVLQAPVVIKEPSVQTPSFGMRTGILALYIDDEGRVLQVLGQEPALPAEYEQAAREAFLEARYTPGRIDGRAVKSRVRVEVKFNGATSPP